MNWVPRLENGKKFIVEGDLLDFETDPENPNRFEERWKSSKIVERHSQNVVITKKTPYVLEGTLDIAYAKMEDTPQFIIRAFRVRRALNRF